MSHLILSHYLQARCVLSRFVPHHRVSLYPVPSHLVRSRLILSHPVSSHPIQSSLLLSQIPSCPTSCHYFLSLLASWLKFRPILSHLFSFHVVSFRSVTSWPVLMSSSPFVFRFGHSCSTSLRSTTSSPVAFRSFPSYPIPSQVIRPSFVQACLVQIYLPSPFTLFPIDSHSILFCYILFSPSVSNSSPFTIESLHIRLYSQPHWSKYLKDLINISDSFTIGDGTGGASMREGRTRVEGIGQGGMGKKEDCAVINMIKHKFIFCKGNVKNSWGI